MAPHKYVQLTSDKLQRRLSGERTAFRTNGVGGKGHALGGKKSQPKSHMLYKN